jgi:hypothetical protein
MLFIVATVNSARQRSSSRITNGCIISTRSDFAGCVCDESSILKNFEGTTKAAITEFMRKMRYRLLCTATAAPNDYIELGTSSEALGYLGYMDMLGQFFKNDQGGMQGLDATSFATLFRG